MSPERGGAEPSTGSATATALESVADRTIESYLVVVIWDLDDEAAQRSTWASCKTFPTDDEARLFRARALQGMVAPASALNVDVGQVIRTPPQRIAS